MNQKLTLSVPPDTVEKAKQYAKKHGTSVSALFASVIESLPFEPDDLEQASVEWPELRSFVGLIDKPKAFDERSRRIIEKHG
jgi:hypothetical protein